MDEMIIDPGMTTTTTTIMMTVVLSEHDSDGDRRRRGVGIIVLVLLDDDDDDGPRQDQDQDLLLGHLDAIDATIETTMKIVIDQNVSPHLITITADFIVSMILTMIEEEWIETRDDE